MGLKKTSKRFGNEAQQTVEQLALEEDLDYSGKRKTVDLENKDALDISVQEREGYATWSGGKIPSSPEFSDKNKILKDFTKKKKFCREECTERFKKKEHGSHTNKSCIFSRLKLNGNKFFSNIEINCFRLIHRIVV